MKYYSEITNKLYDTPELLKEAERKASDVKASVVKARTDCAESKKALTKKQMAAEVEAAEVRIEEARAKLELAKQRAQDISKKYLEEIDSIMEPAKQELKDAQLARYEAIQRFNKEYGAYQKVYNGAQAADEFARALADITSVLPAMFRF